MNWRAFKPHSSIINPRQPSIPQQTYYLGYEQTKKLCAHNIVHNIIYTLPINYAIVYES